MPELMKSTKTRPMPEIGKWRPAGVLRDGWQILEVTKFEETGKESWLTIERAMQITAPLRVVSLKLSDGSLRGCPADRESGFEFFVRTHAEIKRAEAAGQTDNITLTETAIEYLNVRREQHPR